MGFAGGSGTILCVPTGMKTHWTQDCEEMDQRDKAGVTGLL